MTQFLTHINHVYVCLTALIRSSLHSIFLLNSTCFTVSHTISSSHTVMWQSVQSLPSLPLCFSQQQPPPPRPSPRGVTPTDRTNFLLIGPQEIAPRFNLLLDSHEDMWSTAAFLSPSLLLPSSAGAGVRMREVCRSTPSPSLSPLGKWNSGQWCRVEGLTHRGNQIH